MASPERARARNGADVFRTVNTLAYQKHRNDPGAPPGFSAHLEQAQNVVMDKLAGLKPKEPRSLSVIQMQDEAYIHQQMIANAKAKQAQARAKPSSMGTAGNSKAPQGLHGIGTISRAMRPSLEASRKVRFTGAGGNTMQPVRAGEDSTPASPSGSNNSNVFGGALPGPTVKGMGAARFGGVTVMAPVKAATLALPSPSGRSSSVGFAQSAPDSPGAPPMGRAASLTSPGSNSSPAANGQLSSGSHSGVPMGRASSGGLAMPRSSSPGLGPAGAAGGVSAAKEGGGSLMDSWQQHGGEGPTLSQEGSLPSTTLADRSMQRLRAQPKIPGPPPPPPVVPYAEGYKPLTITDSLFERWNNASYGYNVAPVPSSSGAKGGSSGSGGRGPGSSSSSGSSGPKQSGRATPVSRGVSPAPSSRKAAENATLRKSADAGILAAAQSKSGVLAEHPVRESFPPAAAARTGRRGSTTSAPGHSDAAAVLASLRLPAVHRARP